MKEQMVKEILQRVQQRMRADEAKYLITSNGLICRVIAEDGIQFYGTGDFVGYRINLEITNGIVTEARIG